MCIICKKTKKMVFIVTISGNIGSGKSTVLRELQSHGYNCIQEPIDKWYPWLQLFYKEPSKYALGFQMQILKEFYKILIKENHENTIIMERGMADSIFVFSKNLLLTGILSESEYKLIYEYYTIFNVKKSDVYIYIKTPPNICMERLKLRNRECEQSLPLEYIKQINELYNQYYDSLHEKMHIVDGTNNVNTVVESVLTILKTYSL